MIGTLSRYLMQSITALLLSQITTMHSSCNHTTEMVYLRYYHIKYPEAIEYNRSPYLEMIYWFWKYSHHSIWIWEYEMDDSDTDQYVTRYILALIYALVESIEIAGKWTIKYKGLIDAVAHCQRGDEIKFHKANDIAREVLVALN